MNKGTIIYNGYFELPDKSASANRVVANGKIFEHLGYNVVYLGSDYSDENFGGIAQLPSNKNMYVEHHPNSTKQWLKRIYTVDNLANVMDLFPDTVAVILYNMPSVYTDKVRKYLKGSDIKLFYDCTEWTKTTEGSLPKKIIKSVDENHVRNDIAKLTDGMIVIGSVMEKAYKKYAPVLVLPPLIDVQDPIWHQPTEEHDGFEFCFAGFPGGNKESVDRIVEAFLTLPEDCYLRIIGMTVFDFLYMYPEFEDKLNDRMMFMGRRSHETTVACILGCDCYVFIRQNDRRNNAGFPTKFTESFTAGKPIITSLVSDIPSYFKDGVHGFTVKPDDTDDIARAMKKAFLQRKKSCQLNLTFDYRNYIEKTALWLKKTGLDQ